MVHTLAKQRLGPNASILRTIQEYRKPIPVDYLASLHSRKSDEIQPYLNNLEEAGLITIVVKGTQR